MNENVKEWLDKADGDYRTANRELSASDRPNFDAVCFHAHQCIEKTMKGLLIHHEVSPPRIHDLLQLDKLLRKACPTWECKREDLRLLTRAGIAFRYPGESARPIHAKRAFEVCTNLRRRLLELAGWENEYPAE